MHHDFIVYPSHQPPKLQSSCNGKNRDLLNRFKIFLFVDKELKIFNKKSCIENIALTGGIGLKFHKNKNIVIESMDEDNYVLFNSENNYVFKVNDTMASIIEYCKSPITFDELIKRLKENYDIPQNNNPEKEIRLTLDTLIEKQILILVDCL